MAVPRWQLSLQLLPFPDRSPNDRSEHELKRPGGAVSLTIGTVKANYRPFPDLVIAVYNAHLYALCTIIDPVMFVSKMRIYYGIYPLRTTFQLV